MGLSPIRNGESCPPSTIVKFSVSFSIRAKSSSSSSPSPGALLEPVSDFSFSGLPHYMWAWLPTAPVLGRPGLFERHAGPTVTKTFTPLDSIVLFATILRKKKQGCQLFRTSDRDNSAGAPEFSETHALLITFT